MQPEIVADTQCEIGENPLWHPLEKRVYWTDIPRGRMYWYDPATGAHKCFYEGDVVGGFTIQADGALLLFMARGAIKLWKSGQFTTIIDEIPAERESRFNDVIADPYGRVYCGTMSTESRLGRLYLLETDATLKLILDNVGTSNGLGFTRDQKSVYHTDSRKREIYRFKLHYDTGYLSHRQVFVSVPEGEGGPDGMTVDAEGRVWSARWDGGCLVRYDAEGKEERRIEFPARKVSSLTFGGDKYEDVYVTTAGGQDRENEGSGAGALFRVQVGVKGVPEFMSRVGMPPEM
ncbi:MAG: SMP-30/gluconolactonase/LRE family protein [Anaerolineae bacterium]|nr:SMP-30/gluconolactonase/LRE family protein [Anaerolineae bacterium]